MIDFETEFLRIKKIAYQLTEKTYGKLVAELHMAGFDQQKELFDMFFKSGEASKQAEIDSLKAQLANESKRLDFMLKDNRVVVINTNWNENNERVGEGFCVNNVCWIDGWDRLTSSVHETERGAIDAAMIEAEQENGHSF